MRRYIKQNLRVLVDGGLITAYVKEKFQKGFETILLVEDEKSILQMVKTMLERLGYTVLTANFPEEAMRIGNPSNIKCLYMSGYTSNVIAHRGVLGEGLNFIHKPFSKKDISLKIREILDEKNN